MAMGPGRLGQSQSTINVTPLIDVLLVLLVIFIMVTPVLTKVLQSEIPQRIDQPLPAEYTGQQLVLHVSSEGRLLLNRQGIEMRDLPHSLRGIFAKRTGRRIVFLDADGDVAYGTVVQVMDLCRDGGAEIIGVVPDSVGLASRGGA